MEKREDIQPYETICNNHNQIVWMLKEFKKTGDTWYIDQSIKLTRYCKKQGQSMEKRLKLYVDVFTRQLGFQSIYKSQKDKDLKSWQQ